MASSSGSIGMGRVAIATIVWLAAIAGAVALSTAVAHSIHTSTGKSAASVPTSSRPTATSGAHTRAPAPPFDPSTVKATDRRSLFRGANFSATLAVARRRLGPRAEIEQLRVSPGEAQIIVLRHGRQRLVSVRADRSILTVGAGPVFGSTEVFYLSQIPGDAPAALARRIAAHGHVPLSRLDYMLVRTDPTQHRFYWLVYPTNGLNHFQADNGHSPILESTATGMRTLSG